MLVLTLLQTLYSGTIRFNILLGAIKLQAEVTQEEIERVCRDANILDFINSLPKFVSPMCILFISMTHLLILYFQKRSAVLILKSVTKALSSRVVKNVCPQCMTLRKTIDDIVTERIAIARALIRNPKILLLDEVCGMIVCSYKFP